MLNRSLVATILLLLLNNVLTGQNQPFSVRGQVLYNPAMNDCFQQVPCVDDIALTEEDDWVPTKAAVNIVAKSTGQVAKTDRMGNYSIAASTNDTLLFLYVGHNRVEVPVNSNAVVDVKLTPTPIPVIERLMGLIMPAVDSGEFPDIGSLAEKAGVNRATARDMLWLVLGNTRMRQHYPGEFIPDYRFSD